MVALRENKLRNIVMKIQAKFQVKEVNPMYLHSSFKKHKRYMVCDSKGYDAVGDHMRFKEAHEEASRLLIQEHLGTVIAYHREPTKVEIKFGEGAIHYKDFGPEKFIRKDGEIKKRLKCPIDGLIYTY